MSSDSLHRREIPDVILLQEGGGRKAARQQGRKEAAGRAFVFQRSQLMTYDSCQIICTFMGVGAGLYAAYRLPQRALPPATPKPSRHTYL